MLKDFFTGVRGSDNKDDFPLVVQPILDENVSFFINYVNPCCWISCQVKKKNCVESVFWSLTRSCLIEELIHSVLFLN